MKRWQTAGFYGGDNNEGSRKQIETLTSYYCRGRQRLIQMWPRSEIKNLAAKKWVVNGFFCCFFPLFCSRLALSASVPFISASMSRRGERGGGGELVGISSMSMVISNVTFISFRSNISLHVFSPTNSSITHDWQVNRYSKIIIIIILKMMRKRSTVVHISTNPTWPGAQLNMVEVFRFPGQSSWNFATQSRPGTFFFGLMENLIHTTQPNRPVEMIARGHYT